MKPSRRGLAPVRELQLLRRSCWVRPCSPRPSQVRPWRVRKSEPSRHRRAWWPALFSRLPCSRLPLSPPGRGGWGLKSAAVGGGTLAGSGRGTAASIASSAAELRGVSFCANAELADTVRKVAATVIKTRSYPARFFQQSRIIHTPWVSCPALEQPWFVRQSFRESADLIGF